MSVTAASIGETSTSATEREQGGRDRGEHRRNPLLRRDPQRTHVARGPIDQVPAARLLHRRERQVKHAVDEVLAQLREHRLTEVLPGHVRIAAEHALHTDGEDKQPRQHIDVP